MDDLRAELQRWLARAWSPEHTVGQWWRALTDDGWSQPSWPLGLGGRGLATTAARTVLAELAAHQAIAPPTGGVAASLAAPTLLEHGTPEQQRRYLPRMADGTESWCQLFSEPGSGSDLASLGTRAVRTDEGWRVSGQKVWSSGADLAQRGLLLARTNRDVPKHHGITYFVLDMGQPGVLVRPLKQMNGASTFTEVFLDEVLVTDADVIGAVGHGWSVAQTTLRHERRGVGSLAAPAGLVAVPSGPTAGYLDRPIADVLAARRRGAAIAGYAVPMRVMLELARDRRRDRDPHVRQQLARYYTATRINRITGQRYAAQSHGTGAEGSLIKLMTSGVCTLSRDVVFEVLGASGLLSGADAPMGGAVHAAALGSFGSRIGGGTDEVQKNVIGERGLGLPREPQADRDVPYRELRVGTQPITGASPPPPPATA